jgi:type VI secretion system protein
MKTFLKHAFLTLALLNLTACGILDYIIPKGMMDFASPKGVKLDWDGVTILAAKDANLNSPVALDVVILKDEASLNLLSSIPAAKWFATRGEMEKTFPQAISYKSFEVVPGQTLRIAATEFGSARVAGAVMYADYLTPGEHRIRVDQLRGAVSVQLGAQDFTVTAQPLK